MPKLALKLLDNDPRNANRCDDTTLDKIKRNIERTGLCPPLLVRPHHSQKGRYILLDGHHRKLVLDQLGWEKVECQIWDINDQEAQLALVTLNRLRGTDDLQKRASLLDSLSSLMPLEDLYHLIPETSTELDDLLKLARYDFEEMEQALEKQMAAEKAILPIALTFLLAPSEASLVEETLKQYQKKDCGEALVALCQEVSCYER